MHGIYSPLRRPWSPCQPQCPDVDPTSHSLHPHPCRPRRPPPPRPSRTLALPLLPVDARIVPARRQSTENVRRLVHVEPRVTFRRARRIVVPSVRRLRRSTARRLGASWLYPPHRQRTRLLLRILAMLPPVLELLRILRILRLRPFRRRSPCAVDLQLRSNGATPDAESQQRWRQRRRQRRRRLRLAWRLWGFR